MGYRTLLVFTLVLFGCAKNELQNGAPPLDGNWHLTKVTCDGQESTLVSSSSLANGSLVSTANIQGATASRTWTIGSCVITTSMTPFTYGAGNTVTATDGPAKCSDACGGASNPACTNPSEGKSLTYGWSISGNSFVLSLPAEATSGSASPCGQGQATDRVEFTYVRQ